MITKFHHFSVLAPSSLPFICSVNSLNFFFSLLLFFKTGLFLPLTLSLLILSFSCFYWWILFGLEMNNLGQDSFTLETSMKFGMILMISSEVFFFFSFFWSYFHFLFSPVMEVGLEFPPLGVEMFFFMDVPLLNTSILLFSGITATVSHDSIIKGKYMSCLIFLVFTALLGMLFNYFQVMEYKNSFFSMSDSNFGTIFFVLTGFHGSHVLVGIIFLLSVSIRTFHMIISKEYSPSFEMAAWYWHFVDVVWIFLFFTFYYMNN